MRNTFEETYTTITERFGLGKHNKTVQAPVKTRDNPISQPTHLSHTTRGEVNKVKNRKNREIQSEEELLGNPQGQFEIVVVIRDDKGKIVKQEDFPVSGTTAAWRKYDNLINTIKDER